MKNNNKLQKNVVWLGITSFFTDVSSEMIFPILPIFLKTILGAPYSIIGAIDGIAELISSIMKYFSGVMSDVYQKRKNLTLVGYSFSAISKLFFFLANSWITVFIFRILDRIGKGIRTSPRDALITESVNENERGKYFGLHRAMDSAGAVLGVLIAVLILYFLTGKDSAFSNASLEKIIRIILFISFIPALIGVIFLFGFAKDVVKTSKSKAYKIFNFKGFSSKFYLAVLILSLFSLSNISYSFFILRSQNDSVSIFLLPLLYLVYNIFYGISSYPAGKLSDKIGRIKLLTYSLIFYSLILLGFGYFQGLIYLWILFALYGIFIGISDGVSKAFIADLMDVNRKSESFGLYYVATGVCVLFGNVMMGILWDKLGANFAFILPALFAVLSGILLAVFFRDHIRIQQK